MKKPRVTWPARRAQPSQSPPAVDGFEPNGQRPAPLSAVDEIFQRHPANPIITAADLPFEANVVFNPGATLVDGETLLLMRVEDRRGLSQLHVGRSHDGATGWRVEPKPLLGPSQAVWQAHGAMRIPGWCTPLSSVAG